MFTLERADFGFHNIAFIFKIITLLHGQCFRFYSGNIGLFNFTTTTLVALAHVIRCYYVYVLDGENIRG